MMYTSKAVGGPLDGVSVSAGADWLGTVKRDPKGHYEWSILDQSWCWRPNRKRRNIPLSDFVYEREKPGPKIGSKRRPKA